MPTTTNEVNVPKHIPAHLVYDFHIFGDDRYAADPYSRVQEILREAPPVFWSKRGNCWYIASYEALVEAFKDTDHFSNILRTDLPEDFVYTPYPLSCDPPVHKVYAEPLKEVFSVQSVAKLERQMRELAIKLITDIASDGECNFIEAIAEPYPILIFLKILGVPEDCFAEFRQVAVEYLNEPDPQIRFPKMVRADELMSEFIEERRKKPENDLISHLWTLELDGKPISMVDMRRYGMMLFTAGLDSVTNGLGHTMNYLAHRPKLQTWMREHPEEIRSACEELLGRHGVTTPPRRVAKDIEFYGAPMKEDDFVEMYVIAGNLDEKAFEDPTEFHIRRNTTHLTFGFGIHRCIGAHLARLEMRCLMEEWLKRMPEIRIAQGKKVTFDPGHVLRVATLLLAWDADKVVQV